MSKKNGDLWFPHDYNAGGNPQLTSLMLREGVEGYGIYWCMIETMHKSENGMFEKKQYNYDALAMRIGATACDRNATAMRPLTESERLKATADRIKAVLQTCVDVELFEENEQFIVSLRVIENLENAKKISQQNSENARKLWLKKAKGMRKGCDRIATASDEDAKNDKIRQDKIRQEEEKDIPAQTRVEMSFEDFVKSKTQEFIKPNEMIYPNWISDNEFLKERLHYYLFTFRPKINKKLKNTGLAISKIINRLENDCQKDVKTALNNIDYSITKSYEMIYPEPVFDKASTEDSGKFTTIIEYARSNIEKLKQREMAGEHGWKIYLITKLKEHSDPEKLDGYITQHLKNLQSITDIIEFAEELNKAVG